MFGSGAILLDSNVGWLSPLVVAVLGTAVGAVVESGRKHRDVGPAVTALGGDPDPTVGEAGDRTQGLGTVQMYRQGLVSVAGDLCRQEPWNSGADMADRARHPSVHQRPPQLTARRIAALLLAVLAVAFVLQDRGETTLVMLGVSFSAPLWRFTLALLVTGIIVGALLGRRRSAT